MKPLIRIVAGGEDVTAPVSARLVDLRITDEAGIEADTLTLTLDDRDGQLIVPPHQSRVQVWLGILGGPRPVPLTPMGSWQVDETELSGPTRLMRISATPADMSGPIRSPRTRAWEATTLGDIARSIAGAAGLTPVIAEDLASVVVPYVAQTAESDLHLLTRLVRRVAGIVKPADGRLVLARRGAAIAADGTELGAVALTAADTESWTWRAADRGTYASAEASWTELGAAAVNKVLVGEGDPRRVLRHVYATEDEAARGAQAALEEGKRGAQTLTLRLAGFRPDAFAGARVTFADLRPETAGAWTVVSAVHELSRTLTTELSLERPAE